MVGIDSDKLIEGLLGSLDTAQKIARDHPGPPGNLVIHWLVIVMVVHSSFPGPF